MKGYFLLLIFLLSAVVLYEQHQVETIFSYPNGRRKDNN